MFLVFQGPIMLTSANCGLVLSPLRKRIDQLLIASNWGSGNCLCRSVAFQGWGFAADNTRIVSPIARDSAGRLLARNYLYQLWCAVLIFTLACPIEAGGLGVQVSFAGLENGGIGITLGLKKISFASSARLLSTGCSREIMVKKTNS